MIERTAWNQFVLEHGPRSGRFLQSWEWGEFQQTVGETVCRETFAQEGEIVGAAQWIDRQLPFLGTYRFCPKGPIGSWQPYTSRQIFLRVESHGSTLPTYAHKTIDINPAHTLVTDVSISEDELLAGMHPKTRYNIRLARKLDVSVKLNQNDFESVWPLFQATSSRGTFRLHSKAYYLQMLDSLHGDGCRAFLATASHEGNVLAANIMVDFGDTRTYMHGASASVHRQLMAPSLLHWELLREAKIRGLCFYDWWGVAPADASIDHPWSGISRFKRGFGGIEYTSPGTHDLVVQSSRYRLYQAVRFFMRHARRYV